jgi:hypothetical protein
VRFRPPRAFVGLRFFRDTEDTGPLFQPGLLGTEVRTVGSNPVEIQSVSGTSMVHFVMSPEDGGWNVANLRKTTVLFNPQ